MFIFVLNIIPQGYITIKTIYSGNSGFQPEGIN